MLASSSLILVDGSSYLFRAYYAMPELSNSNGHPTGAIYGVVNMLRRLLKDYPGIPIAVVFDTKGKTFRNDLYSEYKANRAAMPDDLAQQIEPLHQIIRALGFPLILAEGVEADDVIGTLAVAASRDKRQVIISTGDKDMAQLVDGYVTLVNTMTDVVMDEAGVKAKFGVLPSLIVDYLTLIGDTSDNIPGVPKVGPKTAVKWLDAYGSLAGVVDHASDIKGKVGENLRASLDQIPLSKELVTIQCDVELDVQHDELVLVEQDVEFLRSQYQEFEFKHWFKELELGMDTQPVEAHSSDAFTYKTILEPEQWVGLLTQLNEVGQFALDTETTSLNDMTANLVGLSFSVMENEAFYLPLSHDYDGAPQQLDKTDVLTALQPLLQDRDKVIVGHNLKYDYKVLKNAGVTITASMQDTLLQSYVLSNVATRHDMDTLADQRLQRTTTSFEEVAGKGVKQLTFNQVPLEQASAYAAEDADVTLQLYHCFSSELVEHETLKQVYQNIELPLMPILAEMEFYGVLIDVALLEQQSVVLEKRLTELEEKAFSLADERFNLGSPKQLQHILFEKMQLPIIKKTPKGQPSTAESVLQALAADYPLPDVIVEYRRLSKLKSTYTDKLPEEVNLKTGRVHTHYNQAVTATGRLSSNNPNLQNIPIKTPDGRKIRQAFIAPEGKKIVAADYSQVELRIMAHVSQDPGLLKAFKDGVDVHQATAAEVFGVALDEVTDDQRRHAKAINFGLLYGMSSFGLAQQLNIDRQSAQNYIDLYFSRYPGVQSFMDKVRETAKQQGYVSTLAGRKLVMPEINSKQAMRRKAAERAAINAPLQGTAADIIKMAMIDVDKWLKARADVVLLMQVHDELVFEVDASAVDDVVSLIKRSMEHVVELDVPLVVDVGVGDNWDEAH